MRCLTQAFPVDSIFHFHDDAETTTWRSRRSKLFFTDNAHFEELLAEDAFLEHAKVYDHYYGTPKEYVFRMLSEGKHVMLEIDIQGAMQVKERYPQGVFIYVVPPSMDILADRLRHRNTDSPEVITGRLAKAADELSWIEKYDYIIVMMI